MTNFAEVGGALNGTISEIYTIGLSLFVILLSLKLFRKSKHERNWPQVPGAKPIVGNDIGGVENYVNRLEEWAERYGKEKGIYECNIFGNRMIFFCSEEKAALIDSKRPFSVIRDRKLAKAINSVGSNGLVSAEGENWKHDRRMVAPLLNHKHVKDYLPTVKLVSQRLIEKWTTVMATDGVVNAGPGVLSLTFDIMSKVGFGMDLDSVTRGDTLEGKDIQTILRCIMIRLLSPLPFWEIPFIGQYLDGCGGARRRMKNLLNKLVREYEEREERAHLLVSEQHSDNDGVSEVQSSFLGKVIAQSKKNSTKLNRERLVGNLFTFLAAGTDTSQVTIVSSLYEIAKDKTGLQDELAAEARALGNLEDATMDDIYQKLPRLRSLMYEVLRIKGPTPFLHFETVKPLEVEEVILPPKTLTYVMNRFISTQESPEKNKSTPKGPRNADLKSFCARRWLVDTEGNPSDTGDDCTALYPTFKEGFRAFGSGMRVCPGRRLGEIDVLVPLCRILCAFQVSLEEGHPPMKLVTGLTQFHDVDIRLVLKPRK